VAVGEVSEHYADAADDVVDLVHGRVRERAHLAYVELQREVAPRAVARPKAGRELGGMLQDLSVAVRADVPFPADAVHPGDERPIAERRQLSRAFGRAEDAALGGVVERQLGQDFHR